jgi:hypothetical protein
MAMPAHSARCQPIARLILRADLDANGGRESYSMPANARNATEFSGVDIPMFAFIIPARPAYGVFASHQF